MAAKRKASPSSADDPVLFGNRMPASLSPVDTGDPDADAAIGALQGFPISPHTPQSRPSGPEYAALLARAERVGPAVLVRLLDDAAIDTGVARWNHHQDQLAVADRRRFKAHYDKCLAALAIRKAYLHWLIAAVCSTPAGLERALEIVREGTKDARLTAASALWASVIDPAASLRVAAALELRDWDGRDPELERVYRIGVGLASRVDPAAAFDRYAELLGRAQVETEAGELRAQALLYGLLAAKQADPRWTAAALPLLDRPQLANLVLMLLEQLPADPSWVEPLCAYLPDPSQTTGFWNRTAVAALARAADARALPWLVAALHASWMNWSAVFEGFAKVGDPSMAHVVRAWLADNGAPDRNAAGEALIAEFERDGPAPAPTIALADPEQQPAKRRPTLVYTKAGKFDAPKLDSLAKLTKAYAQAFVAAGLDRHFEALARPALWLIPKRVDERKLGLGLTKLGGHPDLPAAAKWPRAKREPLTFLAQIDLAEVSPQLPAGALPSAGLLALFIGNDPDGPAGYCEVAKAIFTPPGTPVVRREVPEDFTDLIYQAATVRLHPTLSLPSPTHPHVTKQLRGDARERYEAEVFDDTAPMLPQLLGYRRHGYDAELKPSAQMLLQLPGDNQTQMQFGDVEVLALFVAASKLAAGEFGKVWPYIGD
jgi:hypothetical protein